MTFTFDAIENCSETSLSPVCYEYSQGRMKSNGVNKLIRMIANTCLIDLYPASAAG